MKISEFLDSIIGFQPTDFIITDSGQYLRWIDQRYIACVVVIVVLIICLFYGVLNIVRIVSKWR